MSPFELYIKYQSINKLQGFSWIFSFFLDINLQFFFWFSAHRGLGFWYFFFYTARTLYPLWPPNLLKTCKVNPFCGSFQFFTFTSIFAEKTYSMNLVFTPKGNHFGIGKYFSYCISEHYLAKIFAWTFHDASSSSWTIELKTTEVINGVFEISGCEGTKITAQMPLFRTSFFLGQLLQSLGFQSPKMTQPFIYVL